MHGTIKPLKIKDALLLRPDVKQDHRGFFKELYKFEYNLSKPMVQSNVSFSHKGVLRGLHGDPEMGKLVTVLNGVAFDVMVDYRPDSPTYLQWEGFLLSADNHIQLWIPPGCLHGFLALSDNVVFTYLQTSYYNPQTEINVRFDDPSIGIKWPTIDGPILSEKDSHYE